MYLGIHTVPLTSGTGGGRGSCGLCYLMLDLLTPTWTAWIGLMGKDMPDLLELDDRGWGGTQGKLPLNRERGFGRVGQERKEGGRLCWGCRVNF